MANRQFITKQATFTESQCSKVTKTAICILWSVVSILFMIIYEQLDSIQYHKKDFAPGIFAEYTFKWNTKITLVAGLRGDYHTSKRFK